jgi:hypothetical protein
VSRSAPLPPNWCSKTDYVSREIEINRLIYLSIRNLILNSEKYTLDDLNGVVVECADCYSKGPGFESRVRHGPNQKV